jgi:putative phosphoesterase
VPPKPRRAHVALDAPPDGPLKLAVVADTHSRPHPGLAAQLRALAPHAILHAGDIGELSVLDDLAAIAPVHAVRGNIDARAPHLPDELVVDLPGLRVLLVHYGVNGPRLRPDAARLAAEVGAGLVICGHSHVPFVGRDRGIAVFNPGSVGPRRFALPIVYGWLEVGPDGVRVAHVDAETGATWRPPR